MRPRGTGSLYRQKGSRYWWVKYSHGGRTVRESTKIEASDTDPSKGRREAERYLKARLAQVETCGLAALKPERVRYEEMAQDLLNHFVANGKRSLVERKKKDKEKGPYVPGEPALRKFFAGYRAVDITTSKVEEFKAKRREQGKSNATINRSLAALKAMFNLAIRAGKLRDKPYIPMLEERNVRKGFVDDETYTTLKEKAPLWLRAALAVAYTYGWRKGELLAMRVRQVNLLDRTLTLDPGSTKNDEGRTVKMTGEVFELMRECVRDKQAEDYVFSRRNGGPVRDFRRSWRKLCVTAGVPALLFHDLRRSAVRNLERSGVSRSVAMKLTGHKTEAVYRRYAIVSESDLAEAAEKLEQARNGHSTVIVEPAAATVSEIGSQVN